MTLIITLLGYNTIKTTLDIRRNKTLDFVMAENSVTLNTVEGVWQIENTEDQRKVLSL